MVAGWNFVDDVYRTRKAQGHFDIWCQTVMSAARGAPWLNLFPEYPMAFHRAWGWWSWRYGLQGIEWWSTTLWWDSVQKRRIDVWNDPTGFPTNKPMNMDGRLLYPGTPDAIGGPHIPIASLRLKALRETIEDYEDLHLLDARGGSTEIDALLDRVQTPDATRGEAMRTPLHIVPGGKPDERVVESWWEGDGDMYLWARASLAAYISGTKPPPEADATATVADGGVGPSEPSDGAAAGDNASTDGKSDASNSAVGQPGRSARGGCALIPVRGAPALPLWMAFFVVAAHRFWCRVWEGAIVGAADPPT